MMADRFDGSASRRSSRASKAHQSSECLTEGVRSRLSWTLRKPMKQCDLISRSDPIIVADVPVEAVRHVLLLYRLVNIVRASFKGLETSH
jgi:hypothetical protein